MRSPVHSWLVWPAAALVMLFGACGDASVPSPFGGQDAGADADAAIDVDTDAADAGPDPTLGPPCADRGQCDDGIDCTEDDCDLELGRCRFVPDHAPCADDVYCDGEERCEPGLGCREGEPVSCSDLDICTIDRCIEETRSCESTPRDADGDGDVLRNCEGGGDCDDHDPLISSEASERCENQIDDDCDGEIDEEDCVRPEYDTCADALEIEADGNYALSFAGAAHDYALSCEGDDQDAFRDLVVAVIVPDGDPMDVDITARTSDEDAEVVLGSATQCGKVSSETECRPSFGSIEDGRVARIRLRNLEPGAHPVYVASKSEQEIALGVRFEEPTPEPENETCGSAISLEPEQHALVSLVGVDTDLESACSMPVGELVYRFELAEPQDVRLRAVSLDELGRPVLSLRGGPCASEELTCRRGGVAELFARALPAGEHFVAVSGTGPTDLDLVLEVDPATSPLPGEGCDFESELEDGTTDVDFEDRPDVVQNGCLEGAPDASFELEVDELSDVLVVARLSEGDRGSILLSEPPCETESQALECTASSSSPLRMSSYAVEPGSYRIVVESATSKPIAFERFLRPSAPPVLVAFADECDTALTIPPSGGRFEGNTANQYADYDASCDEGGGPAGGAPEQMLKLELTSERRVILDMRGSEFDTVLSVRRGPECPGTEVTLGCSAGYVASRSFLDLTLEPGTYFVQIDGFDGDEGRWFLDAYVEPP